VSNGVCHVPWSLWQNPKRHKVSTVRLSIMTVEDRAVNMARIERRMLVMEVDSWSALGRDDERDHCCAIKIVANVLVRSNSKGYADWILGTAGEHKTGRKRLVD